MNLISSACRGVIGVVFVATTSAFAQPATQAALHPAASPGEAIEHSMQAMADGDEAKFRQAVDLRSPNGYSEAYTRWLFASARLHKAVREQNVTGKRVRDAGWDRNETLSPSIPGTPTPKESDAMLKAIRQLEWTIDGNIATPKNNPSLLSGGTQGKTSIERSGDRWIVVIADPSESAPPEQLQTLAKSWSTQATAIDSATEQVNAGKLKTIREINDFIAAERKNSATAK